MVGSQSSLFGRWTVSVGTHIDLRCPLALDARESDRGT
jgi:hypothetical protein